MPLESRAWRSASGELEASVPASSPYALLSTRISTDVTGTASNGQEWLLWADFPIIRDKLLIMPGMGVMIRSDKDGEPLLRRRLGQRG